MSQHLSAKFLRLLAQIVEMGKVKQLERAAQAIAERKPFGESSLDGKEVALYQGYRFTEAHFEERVSFLLDNGQCQELMRHRFGGGWVPANQDEHDPSMPLVEGTVYVGPWAMVTGNARVFGNVWIDSEARVGGNAIIRGLAGVEGRVIIWDHAVVTDCVEIESTDPMRILQISGYTRLGGSTHIGSGAFIHQELTEESYYRPV